MDTELSIDEAEVFKSEIHHLLTCGLLAVEIARTEGVIGGSETASTIFLGKWLKLAVKQKRFSRDLSNLIQRFLDTYLKNGPHAKLKTHFFNLYIEYRIKHDISVDSSFSEIERWNKCLNKIKHSECTVNAPLDYDPQILGVYTPTNNLELFILKKDFELSFKGHATFSAAVNFYVVGEPQFIIDSLFECGFIIEVIRSNRNSNINYHHFRVHSNNNCSGNYAVPTPYLIS